jgi:single-strand DNA-binding protein
MNSITLTGRLTADPEVKSTSQKREVVQFRLAVGRRRSRGEDRGAVFVDVVAFDGLAKSVAEYLTGGRKVAVAGRLELDEWETDAGERRQRHKVVADQVEFLDRPAVDVEEEQEGSA